MAAHVPADLSALYEVYDFKHAAAILTTEFPQEAAELFDALRRFRISYSDVLMAGGNESAVPKRMQALLRPLGWREDRFTARTLVDDQEIRADSHFVDFIKGRVAFDMEWNSKDQTFDRDLFAFRSFFDYDRISLAVLVTRSERLQTTLFKSLGIHAKYGASTTHMGKLLPRLRAGRGGGCPILVFGITEQVIIDDRSDP